MTQIDYYQKLKTLDFGKRIGENIYVLESELEKHNPELYFLTQSIKDEYNIPDYYNIVKFFKASFKISLSYYPHFEEMPHPEIRESMTINLKEGKAKKQTFGEENPQILHRKETFVHPSHPQRDKWLNMTHQEEEEGLYQDTKRIGFKKYWEGLLKDKSLYYKGHTLIRI